MVVPIFKVLDRIRQRGSYEKGAQRAQESLDLPELLEGLPEMLDDFRADNVIILHFKQFRLVVEEGIVTRDPVPLLSKQVAGH